MIVTTAGWAIEAFLMDSQVAASGRQLWAAACSAVSSGGRFVGPTARSSIAPISMRSPRATAWMGALPPASATSTVHTVARGLSSRHSRRGGGNSGGKSEPSRG